MKAFVARLKEDKSDIRRLLDEVAKKNMCTYYNMLLPEQVLDPRFFLKLYKLTTVSEIGIVHHGAKFHQQW